MILLVRTATFYTTSYWVVHSWELSLLFLVCLDNEYFFVKRQAVNFFGCTLWTCETQFILNFIRKTKSTTKNLGFVALFFFHTPSKVSLHQDLSQNLYHFVFHMTVESIISSAIPIIAILSPSHVCIENNIYNCILLKNCALRKYKRSVGVLIVFVILPPISSTLSRT